MSNGPKNPYKFLYEPGEVYGVPMIGTGARLDHTMIPDGFFCYDLRNPTESENETEYFIAQESLREKAGGCIITAGPIDFQGKSELSSDCVKRYEEAYLMSFDEFVGQHMSQETSELPEHELIQM